MDSIAEKKKMGRPTKAEVARNKKITIRVSESDLIDIEACAKSLEISRTDALLKGIEILKKSIK